MRRIIATTTATLVTIGLGLAPTPAEAASPGHPVREARQAAARVQIAAPATAAYRTSVLVRGRLFDAAGSPVAGHRMLLQRRVGGPGTWRTLAARVTDAEGKVEAREHLGTAYAGENLRARWRVGAGQSSVTEVVDLRRQRARLRLRARDRLEDGRYARLRVRGTTARGDDILGRVKLWKRTSRRGAWRSVRSKRLRSGTASFRVRPRVDTSYRVSAKGRWWYSAPGRDRERINNIPPGRVIRMPSGAPRPSVKLPGQQRAVGGGLNPRIHRVGGRVWRQMRGRSWHRGCPVGRSRLRMIEMNYWGFDGYRHRGELVVNRDVARPAVRAFRDIYQGRQPIRAMYRVDRFGWSKRLRGANDYRSMKADNTSAFNCRQVVGSPGRQSPHSYGRSIDLNPWENPYVTRRGVYPNRWWLPRDRPGPMVHRSRSHPVVRAFERQGFVWGGSYSDFHHFQD
jgi:hypothetical protein